MSDEERSAAEPAEGGGIGVLTEAGERDSNRVVSRRWLLLKAGIALNGFVGVVLAVPVLRYLFAPWRKDASYDSWVSLGPAGTFPAGETRLTFYKNPAMNPWDGQTDDVACYVRHAGDNQFQVSRSIARIWVAQFAGFRSRSFSCARATAECITRTARGPRVRRSAGCSPIAGRSLPASCTLTPARCRHCPIPPAW